MWFLRRKTAVPEASADVLPPLKASTRRIEITLERHSVTRLSRSSDAEPAETVEPRTKLPAPSDG